MRVQRLLEGVDKLNRPKREHFYEEIPGWFDFQYIYSRAVEETTGGIFLEVGTAFGRSTAYMAVEIANSGKQITLHTIDVVDKGIMPKLRERFVGNHVEFHAESSLDFHRRGLVYDFIFFDGLHDYATVKYELENYYRYLKPGCVMGGHDFLNHGSEGERMAVLEFFHARPELEFNLHYISWWTRKPTA
jgi:predicted O-methyltransferase YrrM